VGVVVVAACWLEALGPRRVSSVPARAPALHSWQSDGQALAPTGGCLKSPTNSRTILVVPRLRLECVDRAYLDPSPVGAVWIKLSGQVPHVKSTSDICPYLLSSETTAKGTGLEKLAGKEDPVELDSSSTL